MKIPSEEDMKFSCEYTVRWHDTNANREITPSALLTLMQETTNKHIQTNYPDIEYVRDELHQAFILSKLYMRFYKPAYAYDTLKVETWTGIESRAFTFWRSFRVWRGDEIIADALTYWALLDTQTHKLLPVKAFKCDFVDEESIDIKMPHRVAYPADAELCCVGSKRILYGDIDYNRHMNNTHYPNMLLDYLPCPEHLRPREMMLSFLRGAQYNDEIRILRAQNGQSFYFRTLDSEGVVGLEAYVGTEERTSEIK